MKYSKWRSFLVLLFFIQLSSCSIIEDDDIQGADELNQRLVLSEIVLSQQINNSALPNSAPGTGLVTTNSDNKIARIDWSGVSAHSNTESTDRDIIDKFRFNYFFDKDDPTAPTLNNARIVTNFTYGSNGLASRIENVDDRNGFEFETFDFSYDNLGRLTQTITNRYTLDSSSVTRTTDNLNYIVDNIVESVDRVFENIKASTSVEQTIFIADDSQIVSQIQFRQGGSTKTLTQFCANTDCYIYGPADVFFDTIGNPAALFAIGNNVIGELRLIDQRVGGGGQTFETSRNPDTFFFHPVLLFPNLFGQSTKIGQVFLFDWWLLDPRDEQSGSMTSDEIVTIDYQYTVN